MRTLALIPLILVTSCVSRPKPRVVVQPLSPPAVEPIEAVRYAEIVRAYHVGRYVEPNQSDVMHEQHSMYRVEEHTRWNLKPATPCRTGVSPLNPPSDSAFTPAPTNDVILAEINRQREATERVMSEAFRLARSYDELQKVIKEMSAVATNHVTLNARLATTERRVVEFEKELQRLNAPLARATNEVGSFIIEEPDKAEP
ncbi:MAG: hypothetical protein ABI651_03380 [Verrucomicrobiota bacterium]